MLFASLALRRSDLPQSAARRGSYPHTSMSTEAHAAACATTNRGPSLLLWAPVRSVPVGRPRGITENGRSEADRAGDLAQFAQRVWALGGQDHPV